MKTKLLKKLRKKAKRKIRLYQTSERIYKITPPYSYQKDISVAGNLNSVIEVLLNERREYILSCVNRLRKEKKNYPILINI